MMKANCTKILCCILASLFSHAIAASLVDPTFSIGSGANGIVEHVLMQPDGKVLICGNFTTFNGVDRPYCARLNSDGSVDTSFRASASYWVRHMALQTDGKIVIGGYFKSVGAASRNLIARLNTDGSLDTSFNPGTGCEVLIAPGVDGNHDPFVMWVEVQPDGKILATGNFINYNGVGSQGLVRINPDGSRDATFNVGGGLDSWGRSIHLLGNGQILVTGWLQNYRGTTANRIARINADGSPDTTFHPFYGDSTAVYSVVVQSDGKMITSGHSLNAQGLFTREIKRINPDGSDDPSWLGSTNEKTECLLLQRDGKVIVVGNFSQVNGAPRKGIARFNADGSVDSTFIADADNYVWTVTPGPSGSVYVSGGFTSIDGVSRPGVARLLSPGSTGGTNTPPAAPTIANARLNTGKFECTVNSAANYTYILEYKTDATSTTWTSLTAMTGTGGSIILTDPNPAGTRFYRVEAR
jgi:uncharacterized delta-60 repeat protein